MRGDFPAPRVGEMNEERVAQEPWGALRDREIHDSALSSQVPQEARHALERDGNVLSIPRSYLCATAMITRVEVLDLEALTELMARKDEGCGDRHSVVRRWNRADNDEPTRHRLSVNRESNSLLVTPSSAHAINVTRVTSSQFCRNPI